MMTSAQNPLPNKVTSGTGGLGPDHIFLENTVQPTREVIGDREQWFGGRRTGDEWSVLRRDREAGSESEHRRAELSRDEADWGARMLDRGQKPFS